MSFTYRDLVIALFVTVLLWALTAAFMVDVIKRQANSIEQFKQHLEDCPHATAIE